jgi:hypothetical protein
MNNKQNPPRVRQRAKSGRHNMGSPSDVSSSVLNYTKIQTISNSKGYSKNCKLCNCNKSNRMNIMGIIGGVK